MLYVRNSTKDLSEAEVDTAILSVGATEADIRAYLAIPNFDFRDTGFFGPGHFRYDPENDHYLCPAQQTLRLHNKDHHNRRKRYRAKPSICNACELKVRCTTSGRGRVLYRPFEEDFYDRVRGYRGTFAYEKALRKRRVWVEPLFAEAKDFLEEHGGLPEEERGNPRRR